MRMGALSISEEWPQDAQLLDEWQAQGFCARARLCYTITPSSKETVPIMRILRVSLISSAALIGIAAPASACDLHEPGQMGGFHRYNPFASALQNFPKAPQSSQSGADVERAAAKTEKQKKEDDRRQRALEEEPDADAERDADLRSGSQQGRSALK